MKFGVSGALLFPDIKISRFLHRVQVFIGNVLCSIVAYFSSDTLVYQRYFLSSFTSTHIFKRMHCYYHRSYPGFIKLISTVTHIVLCSCYCIHGSASMNMILIVIDNLVNSAHLLHGPCQHWIAGEHGLNRYRRHHWHRSCRVRSLLDPWINKL